MRLPFIAKPYNKQKTGWLLDDEETFYDGQKVSVSKMVRAMFEKRLALLKTQENGIRNKTMSGER